MAAGMKKARKQWLVLFDIDGTLLDTHGAGREAFVRGLARWSGVRDELADVSFAGNTDRNVLDQVAATRGWRLGPADIQRIFGFIAEELRQLLQDSPARAIAGAHDLLGRLTTAGAALGLVTGNIRVCAYLKLGSVGFDRFFRFGGYGDDDPQRTRIVHAALAAARAAGIDLATTAACLVGDTPFDVAAGQAAGMPVIGVATGAYDEEALRAAGAQRVAGDLSGPDRFLQWMDEALR